VGTVGEVDYKIEINPGKVKTYHINMLKRYFPRENEKKDILRNVANGKQGFTKTRFTNGVGSENQEINQAASMACVIEDEKTDEPVAVSDADTLTLYNLKQKETVKDAIINPELSTEQQASREILNEYQDIISDVPKVRNLIEHKLQLTETEPVKHKSYAIPYKMQKDIDTEIDDVLAMGVIERSEAPYASPLVLVKKPDNTYRVCINFKESNKITVFDREPMMSPDDIFPKLSGSQYYSTFDFSKGYWALPMEEKSKDYTFITSCGLMRFKVMPFGMVNSGSTYNRMVRKLLDGAHDLDSYVDDVLGHTGDWEGHKQMLRNFFERVKGANLSLKPSKCKIGFDKVNFLGHTLQKKSVGPQVETVGRILKTKRPKTKKECHSLLGMINFYRQYIPNCAEIIAPITELTRNRAPNNVE